MGLSEGCADVRSEAGDLKDHTLIQRGNRARMCEGRSRTGAVVLQQPAQQEA